MEELKVHVELGCGNNRRDIKGWKNIGIDLISGPSVDIECNLGFELIPLEDNSVELVQAFDVFEHIPKCVWMRNHSLGVEELEKEVCLEYDYPLTTEALNNLVFEKKKKQRNNLVRLTPFIHLMNEVWRILKDDGILYCEIPFGDQAFNRDPTHVNRFSRDWALYFSKEDNLYYDQGLVTCNFGYVENTYSKYKWTDEDIMKTKLRAIKKEKEPLI